LRLRLIRGYQCFVPTEQSITTKRNNVIPHEVQNYLIIPKHNVPQSFMKGLDT
jgi:hypothetical protein